MGISLTEEHVCLGVPTLSQGDIIGIRKSDIARANLESDSGILDFSHVMTIG